MAIVVFQHSDACRPGRLGLTLRDHAMRLDIRRLDKGDPFPPDFDNVDAVVSLGGPQNVGEAHPWLEREAAFIREAHERELPVIGICLGAQLIGHALGGVVGPMSTPEVGMLDVDLLPAGQTDTIFAGVPWKSVQFQKHKQEVRELPPGATLLASSPKCKVQAFRAGMRTYAFQFHFEADREMIGEMMRNAVSELHQAGSTPDEFARQLDARYDAFARIGNRLAVNLTTFLIPRVATAMQT